jgi:hypothetical protein
MSDDDKTTERIEYPSFTDPAELVEPLEALARYIGNILDTGLRDWSDALAEDLHVAIRTKLAFAYMMPIEPLPPAVTIRALALLLSRAIVSAGVAAEEDEAEAAATLVRDVPKDPPP